MKQVAQLFRSPFFRDSALFFAVSLLASACNYILIVYVAQNTQILSEWNALTGVVGIALAVIGGFSTHFTRTIASKDVDGDDVHYRSHYINLARKYQWYIISVIALVSSLSVFILQLPLQIGIFIGIFLLLEIALLFNQNYLFGKTNILQASLVLLTYTAIRLVASIGLLSQGWGIYSYVIGYTVGVFFAILLANVYTQRLVRHIPAQSITLDRAIEHTSILYTTLGLFVSSIALSSIAIYTNRTFSLQDSRLAAVIFTVGQLFFFLITAIMPVFLSHATKSKGLKLYFSALGLIGFLYLAGLAFFVLFHHIILSLFNASAYAGQLSIFVQYSIFIAMYAAITFNIQFIIARAATKQLRTISWFALSTFFLSLCIHYVGNSYTKIPSLESFYLVLIVFGIINLAHTTYLCVTTKYNI